MKINIVSGATLAATAIALAISGASVKPASAKKIAKSVQCMGINSCKGTSSCKTAKSACKGMNSCKGEGWVPSKSKEACESAGGMVI